MMMRTSSRERGVEPKREGENKDGKLCKTGSSSSRQWAGGLRNPRIVRVSRSFGGKDRHSKVCTIRGLRDRRIRLSVPTAIQLYDLQDRLGLTQPSKVIDWLLEAAQLDIDKLPPLQIPPGFGHQFQQDSAPFFDPATAFTTYNNAKQTVDLEDQSEAERYSPGYRWDINDAPLHVKEKNKFLGTRTSSRQQGGEEDEEDVNLFPIGNHSSYYHLEAPPSLTLSQFGFLPLANTENNHLNGGAHHFLPSAQLFFCPPAAVTPSPFPHTVEGHDPRHIQLLTSAAHHRIRSSYFNTSQDESQPHPESG